MTAATRDAIADVASHWSAVAGIDVGVARLIISEAVTKLVADGVLSTAA